MLLSLSVPVTAAAKNESALLSAAGQESVAQAEASVDSESAENSSDSVSEPPEFNPLPMYMGGLLGGALIGVLMVKGSNRGGRKL